ncbi:hypothetical protein [Bacillus velezensis]|uniref:hypothetical protein n=1 Tax=Bacillus velezensis TaxID=492670 RepID=UPI001E4E60BB|nr:hypothetical protein [Bacillus velezensis]
MLPQMRINGAAAELFVKGDLLLKNYVPLNRRWTIRNVILQLFKTEILYAFK